MSAGTLSGHPLRVILGQIPESHNVSISEAVGPLARAASYNVDTLFQMLNQGVAFQILNELIVSKAAIFTVLRHRRNEDPTRPAIMFKKGSCSQ